MRGRAALKDGPDDRYREIAGWNNKVRSSCDGSEILPNRRWRLCAPMLISAFRGHAAAGTSGHRCAWLLESSFRFLSAQFGSVRRLLRLLGHSKIESIVRTLGSEVDDAIAIAEKIDI